MPTLLAIHAHPDDESSKGAATVARYADAGVRCVLVTATGGEAGDILNPAMDRGEVRRQLGAIRLEELATATRIIGYSEVVLLGYRDSGMAGAEDNAHPDAFVNADRREALGRLVGIIRRVRPDVMLGYDDHSLYPHPDHLRVHELALSAFQVAGDAAAFPEAGPRWEAHKLYAPVSTLRRLRALHQAMLDLGLESPFEQRLVRMKEAGAKDPEITSVPVADTLERARESLRAHATQVDPEGFWFRVPLDVVRAVYPYEDFALLASRVLVTRPEDDLFAGI